MMAKKPEDRYQTAIDVAEALRGFLVSRGKLSGEAARLLAAAGSLGDSAGTGRRRVGSAPPPRPAGRPSSDRPSSDKVRYPGMGDTVSDVSPDTTKSPGKPSDSGRQRKALPVARSLDDSPFISLDFAGDSDSPPSDKKAGSSAPSRRERETSTSDVRPRQRHKPNATPKWLPFAVLGGLVVAILLFTIAMKMQSGEEPSQKAPSKPAKAEKAEKVEKADAAAAKADEGKHDS
jgi:hypothetical protein